jgi:sirohydrochlorin cobaltochelatase
MMNADRGTTRAALVLFAHGARDPEWSAPFRNIRRKVVARRPDLTVELAFLELMQPALAEVVAQLAETGHRRIVVAPLFMAQGGHLKEDLPRMFDELRGRHPGVTLEMLPALGEVDAVLDAISDWLAGAGRR